MAIDITVRDDIDPSIETKFESMAAAAKKLEDRVNALQKSLGRIGSGGLSSVAASIEARAGRNGIGNSVGGARRSYESAFVTAQKQQNATRKEISKVFTDGFREQEKQRKATEQAFNRSTKAAETAANRQAARLAKVESANVTAAKNLQKTRDEITKVFTAGFQERANRAAAVVQSVPQLAAPKNMRNYIDDVIVNSKPSSTVVKQQQQQLYDSIFGANNLTTSASKQWQSTLNGIVANTKPSSSAARAAQQSLYDGLFNAVPQAKQPQSVNVSSISSNVLKAARAQDVWTRSADNTSSAMQRLDSSVSFLRSDGLRWAKVLWALGGATLTATAIVSAADAYTRLQNRLSVVAKSQEEVNYLTGEMLRIANASRQPIEETAKTFARFDLAMQQLGRTQADSMVLTENVAKALKLGGATAGEAASAMLQLSQAFNKGKLDGDEFRSMMENSPILATELAKSLGVTRGELLKLAPQGKLTAEVMANAWIKSTDEINKAFAKLKPTIAESFTVLRNTMTVFFGELDKSLGITAALAGAIQFVTDNLDTLTFVVLAITPLIAAFVGAQIISGLGTMAAFAGRTAIAIGAIRSPITVVAQGLIGLARNASVAGTSLVTAFTSANTRAIALQMTLVRVAAGTLAVGAAASRAGAMLLSAFSFGNILMVIAVATAALIAFGDQMVVNAEKGVTMRDRTIAVFQEIGDFAGDIFNFIYDTVASAFGSSVAEGMSMGEKISNAIFSISLAAAVTFDAIHTVMSNILGAIVSSVQFIVDTVTNVMTAAVNVIIGLINTGIWGLNKLGSVANGVMSFFGSETQFSEVGMINGFAYRDGFLKSLDSDMVGNKHFAAEGLLARRDNIGAREEKIASERKKQNAINNPRDAAAKAGGADDDKKGKKPKKTAAERRADIIAKVVNEENKAIEVSKRLGDERERVAVIEELNNKLKEKGFALLSEGAGGEREMIARLVQQRIESERVGNAMQAMYEEATQPMLDYAAKYGALDLLLKKGVINQDRYASNIRRIADELSEATEPAHALAKELEKLNQLQGLTGDDRAVGDAVYTARENARSKGMAFTDTDAAKAASLQRQILDMNRATEAAEAITSRTTTAAIENGYAITALGNAYKAGEVSVGMYERELAGLLVTQGQLFESIGGLNANDPFEPMRRGLYQLVAEMPMLGSAMSDAISSTLGNAVDNISSTLTDMIVNFDAYAESVASALERPVSTLDVMRYALADIINQIGKELINAIIKMGVQWAITRAAQAMADKAAIASTTAVQTASMATVATAAAPAAMATSVATAGGSAAAGMSGMTMAMLAVGGIMALAMGAGAFKDGGMLGGMGTGRSDSTLFWGSRGEMVMNRDAVSNNAPLLHAMNNGASAGGGYVDNSVHVTVYYNKDGSTSEEGGGNEFTRDMVRFIDSRIHKGITAANKQGKSGY